MRSRTHLQPLAGQSGSGGLIFLVRGTRQFAREPNSQRPHIYKNCTFNFNYTFSAWSNSSIKLRRQCNNKTNINLFIMLWITNHIVITTAVETCQYYTPKISKRNIPATKDQIQYTHIDKHFVGRPRFEVVCHVLVNKSTMMKRI